MNKEQTLKAIEVMQAYVEGKKIHYSEDGWDWQVVDSPTWDWLAIDYRVKPASKPSINWDHVHPDYKWMATDADGKTFLYEKAPTDVHHRWDGQRWVEACVFNSFIPGDCDWKKSLVQRPESV
jgi:hypothetical protein